MKPSNNAINQKYGPFFIKASAQGGSSAFFGPYNLDVGCTISSVTFTDSASFSNVGITKIVGESTAAVYTFSNPTISR